MEPQTILILGATSDIARSLSLELIQAGYSLILAGRDPEQLSRIAKDLAVRSGGGLPATLPFDALETEKHFAFFKEVIQKTPRLAGLFCAAGVMYEQEACQNNHLLALETMQCNYVGLVSVIELFASFFEEQKRGFISCITSVAGDRGRQSNYLYGSTKGALNIYLQGLRNRLHPAGVLVQTVKCGPVSTRMTRDLGEMPFMVAPEVVARQIRAAIQKRKDILYTPRKWRLIMGIIKALPEWLFKRMHL